MRNMMKTYLPVRNYIARSIVWIAVLLTILAVALPPEDCKAGMKSPPPEKIKAIIIGDRVVDIAYNLGVLPEAMSVRGGLWPMAKKLKIASQILGCPKCITKRTPTIVPDTAKRRIIIEKHPNFWLYEPEVKPENVVPLLEGLDLKIDYVDFTQGIESAIRQTAKLLQREGKGEKLIERYTEDLDKAKKGLRVSPGGRKAIVFSGTYTETGKTFLRVEAPGGYSDCFLLKPLGYENAGDVFKKATGKEWFYPVVKKRGNWDFSPLLKADPDVIIMTGDALAVQKGLSDYLKANPELVQVKALKNTALYSLPFYCDSSVVEYPAILTKWATALSE